VVDKLAIKNAELENMVDKVIKPVESLHFIVQAQQAPLENVAG